MVGRIRLGCRCIVPDDSTYSMASAVELDRLTSRWVRAQADRPEATRDDIAALLLLADMDPAAMAAALSAQDTRRSVARGVSNVIAGLHVDVSKNDVLLLRYRGMAPASSELEATFDPVILSGLRGMARRDLTFEEGLVAACIEERVRHRAQRLLVYALAADVGRRCLVEPDIARVVHDQFNEERGGR